MGSGACSSVFGLGGANPRGSGLPARLAPLSRGEAGLRSALPQQPASSAREVFRGQREMYVHVTLPRKVQGMQCWWVSAFSVLKIETCLYWNTNACHNSHQSTQQERD